jgi:hypothetical protein
MTQIGCKIPSKVLEEYNGIFTATCHPFEDNSIAFVNN